MLRSLYRDRYGSATGSPGCGFVRGTAGNPGGEVLQKQAVAASVARN
jgi:hypothetical protein